MKRLLVLLVFLIPASCARKVEVRAPEIIRGERYSYVKDDEGRWFIIANNSKAFNEAMKRIHPGPASVDRLDLYVITPASAGRRRD
jgi:hypothetical protein